MGLVDDKQGAFIVDIDAIEDLHEHPVVTLQDHRHLSFQDPCHGDSRYFPC
jgi:hypothetical protein